MPALSKGSVGKLTIRGQRDDLQGVVYDDSDRQPYFPTSLMMKELIRPTYEEGGEVKLVEYNYKEVNRGWSGQN